MTDPEITSLAREYAAGRYPNLSEKIISLRTQEIKNAERLIRFLLRRFCLVEKDKIQEEYHEAKFACGNIDPCSETWATYQAQKSVLERLFPEIGKEVEDA